MVVRDSGGGLPPNRASADDIFSLPDAYVVRRAVRLPLSCARSQRRAQLTREVIPSFGNTRYRCVLIVRCEKNSRWPISRFVRPSAASWAICSSCAVSSIARLGHVAPAAFPGCAQLAPRMLGPGRASERVEGVTRSPQDARGTRRHVADVAATGRKRAESWRAGTATVSGRPPAPPSKRSPASAGSATSARAWLSQARSMCRAGSPTLASTCATRARAASSWSMWRRGLSEVRDQPRRDHRVVCGVGGVEQSVGGCVSVAVAAAAERGQHLAELGERHRDVRAHRLCDHLSPCGHQLGRLLVAAHRCDE